MPAATGTYTLVIFAADKNVSGSCGSVVPTVYIDQVGYSRFDNAIDAYDFGVIPPDSVFYNGKVGDVNPLNPGRAPSNDFFYCTTGAHASDPTEADCEMILDSAIYNSPGINNPLFLTPPGNYVVPKRDLWYSFVITHPGNISVKVVTKTPDKTFQPNFAVYQDKVNDSLPLTALIAAGQLDSTKSQGLIYIANNLTGYDYCEGTTTVSFYVNPCSYTTPLRYYVLVDDPSTYPYYTSAQQYPNSQVEVSVLLDSTNAVKPKYDHYYQADTIGLGLGAGVYSGGTDNFTCASADPNDPFATITSCAPKTLWYKFTVGETGTIRYREDINGVPTSPYGDIYLFEQIIPGDSTSKGLKNIPYTTGYTDSAGHTWMQQCISPGTYYLLTIGCSRVSQTFKPWIWITEQLGDFCSRPVVAQLNGAGSTVATVIPDCHTIGTDYGEFGPTLTCPPNAVTSLYKSSWFRIDIGGSDTLDVTAYLVENTNATATDINYRLMTGDCGAMQETSCVQDALTQNTYKCLAPGSYYIQVFTPVTKNGQPVTGTIDLHVSGIHHADTCAPTPKCLSNANFIPQFDCTIDSAVRFINYSTYGSSVTYKWNFGYNGDTSSAVSPSFVYPYQSTNKTYSVTLIVDNTSCGQLDTVTVPVTIPGRPYVNLGPDLTLCTPDTSVILNATSYTGATYEWSTGPTTPSYTVAYAGQNRYSVQVMYNGCVSADTINVFINPINKAPTSTKVICLPDSVQLSYNYGGNTTYTWNTGATLYYIYADTPGTYWVDESYNAGVCKTRDSFLVVTAANVHPLGNDTAVCFAGGRSYFLSANVTGASGWTWQDGSHSYYYYVTKPGQYWVTYTIGTCSTGDTVNVTDGTPATPVIKGPANVCTGDSILLDAGAGYGRYVWYNGDTTRMIAVKGAGYYSVTVGSPGCTVSSAYFQVGAATSPVPRITGPLYLCQGDSLTLDAGAGYTSYAWSNGGVTEKIHVGAPGKILVSVTNASGCAGTDSVLVSSGSSPLTNSVTAAICSGKSYTLPSGAIATATGTFQDTVRSKAGCDSLITSLQLSVTAPVTTTSAATICAGGVYALPSGVVVSAAGLYNDTLRSVSGCDSLITRLTLLVPAVTSVNKSAAICSGGVYTLPSGVVVSAAGSYNDTLHAVGGCDSLITTVTLAVSAPSIMSSRVVRICAGKGYTLPSGTVVSSAGTYNDTVRGVLGCDSLVTMVTLSVSAAQVQSMQAAICSGATYTLPSGVVVSAAGLYNDTLRGAAGCDSLVTAVTLSVSAAQVRSMQAAICSGAVYTLPSGAVVSATGSYNDTVRGVLGCDSLVTSLSLSVSPAAMVSSRSVGICAGSSYTLPSGTVVSAAGLYNDTLRGVRGCDSMVTAVTLSVSAAPVVSSQRVGICAGSGYTLPSGVVVSATGTYNDTVRGSGGCDSMITRLNLTVTNPVKNALTATVCPGIGYSLPSGAVVFQPGNYPDTIRTLAGCDSLITLVNLSFVPPPDFGIKPADPIVCVGDSILLTAYGGDSYEWWPGDGLRTQGGASTYVVPTATSDYTVIISSFACHVTDTEQVTVIVSPLPTISVTKSNDIDCLLSSAQLQASGGERYVWSPASTLSDPAISNPVAMPRSTTEYYVQGYSAAGCMSQDSIEVVASGGDVSKGYPVPNAFTPGLGGKNQCWGILPSSWGNVSNFLLSVFNRQGVLMYTTTDPYQCWDGTYKGTQQPGGTYVYQVSAMSICGAVVRKGTLILIR